MIELEFEWTRNEINGAVIGEGEVYFLFIYLPIYLFIYVCAHASLWKLFPCFNHMGPRDQIQVIWSSEPPCQPQVLP